jgi:hypothetical protein
MRIDQVDVLARATAEGEAEYQTLVESMKRKWPDLEPIPRQPYLTTGGWRGDFGFWTMGHSQQDSDTGTYRTYRVLGWPNVPLVFFGAYRVCEGPVGNVVFIGRHSLPVWARVINVIGAPIATGCVLVWGYVLVQVLGSFVR